MDSPLMCLYKIERILFPEMKTTEEDIKEFEKALAEVYSELDKERMCSYGNGS